MAPDFVVVGAGVFGAWTALHLRRRGHTVTLVDAYGPGNSRSSSGGETRIIRMGYGADALYTRSAIRALEQWKELFRTMVPHIIPPGPVVTQSRTADVGLFINCGMLWLGTNGDPYSEAIANTLAAHGVAHLRLTPDDLRRRFPQFSSANVDFAIYEPGSGVLLARRAVAAVFEACRREGVEYVSAAVVPPDGAAGRLSQLRTAHGETLAGSTFVFCCGSWLPKVFPDLLGRRIFPSRQEIFFFGVPAGLRGFTSPAMPAWLHRTEEIYGLPDIENRGVKIACDFHGPAFDPDSGARMVTEEGLRLAREYVARRLPELRDAPVVETRVCQYENTSSGDFLLDGHPQWENVWLAGGGSGHGFKHGPVVGEYLAGRILDNAPAEPRYSLVSKQDMQRRAVY